MAEVLADFQFSNFLKGLIQDTGVVLYQFSLAGVPLIYRFCKDLLPNQIIKGIER